MKTIQFEDYDQGAEIPSIKTGPITQMDLVRYAGASGDFNPIHNDVEFAKSVGLDGTIAHGMYVMAQLGRLWSSWVSPAQVRNFNTKFKGMAKPGEVLVCTGTIKRKKEKDGEKLLIVELNAKEEKSGDVRAAGEITVVCP